MQDLQGQNALPLPKEDSFPNQSEDPQQICRDLKTQLLHFIADIEHLLQRPILATHPAFLDKVAANLMSLQVLTTYARICSAAIQEIAMLLDNLLRCNVFIKKQDLSLSMLDAAKIYRRSKNSSEPLSLILESYTHHHTETKDLLNALKVLAADLIEEKGNI